MHARRRVAGAFRGNVLPIGLIVTVVLVANGLYLSGLFDPNPMGQFSQLTLHSTPGVFPGINVIDPNSGYTAQALGHRAILDWFSGSIPWWNPFEGLGQPLAGEMQSAAFFPLTILLAFANGQLYLHVILEIISGVATFLLLARLLRSRWSAAIAGAAFALNGTFATIEHAPVNPIAFLPMLLLGLEFARETSQRKQRGGWALIAVSLALSITAGFPETAYIDGLLALVWFVARGRRLGRPEWISYARKTALGTFVGLLLAAPVLVAFIDYLPYADVGGHNGAFANASFPSTSLPHLNFPYIFGPISAFNRYDPSGALDHIWTEAYLGTSLVALAAVGVFGRRYRTLRLCLIGWIVLAVGKTYGMSLATHALNLVPGVKLTAFFVYSGVSWQFAVIVLAAFGFDDLVGGGVSRRWVIVALGVVLAIVAVEVHIALPIVRGLVHAPHAQTWATASILWGVVVLVVVGVVALWSTATWRLPALAVVVLIDVLGLFIVPELSAPRSVTIDQAPVAFLQQHGGQYRFFTFGPIQPNYGSYFSIGSAATNDVPPPKLWSHFIITHLNANVDPLVFTGTTQLDPTGPTSMDEFLMNLANYESVSVKYLVIPTGLQLPDTPETRSFRVVFHDAVAEVLELPRPTAFIHVVGSGCSISSSSIDQANVNCPQPSTLVREELYMPGWTATVDGKSVPVREHDGVVESVDLPRGTSTVAFSYGPPHVVWAGICFVVGVLILLGGPFIRARRRNGGTGRGRQGSGTGT